MNNLKSLDKKKKLYLLITVRKFEKKKVIEKFLNHNTYQFINKILNLKLTFVIAIAIDSRGSIPNTKLIKDLQKSDLFKNQKLIFFQCDIPGKSAAQRCFAKEICESNSLILLNDLDTEIEFNNIKYNYNYVVYDIIGREMMRGALNNGNDQIALNSNLKNGVYEVVLENENIISSSKFILKNNSAL